MSEGVDVKHAGHPVELLGSTVHIDDLEAPLNEAAEYLREKSTADEIQIQPRITPLLDPTMETAPTPRESDGWIETTRRGL